MVAILIALLVLIAAAVPVAAVMGVLGIAFSELNGASRLIRGIGDIFWESGTNFLLMSAPLFILLGEIVLRSGIASRMYNSVAKWITWLPGGLMHANIGACTLFAATSGSSVATTATIGTVAYPEIERRGYNERLFLGSLAAGGTLGILIPPSVAMVLYGVLTRTSVPELYLAGVVPGLALAALFMLSIVIACVIRPEWGGRKVETSWSDRISSLPQLIGPALLFASVVGSIYAGIATPTEAASVGVCMAIVLAAFYKTLSVKMLLESFENTMRTTAMVLLIVFFALFLNFVFGFLGVTRSMLDFISVLQLTPLQTILVIVAFYLVLGMFMETLSMMLITVPIVFPIVMGLKVPEYSDVWFGILMVLLMEAALITPPVGMNLFVAQSIRTRGGSFNDLAIGMIPFLAAMVLMLFLLVFFPGIATWLPNLHYH